MSNLYFKIYLSPYGNSRHNLAVTKLSALLGGITSKSNSESFKMENMLQSHEKVCKKCFSRIAVSFQKENILQFNQHMKLDKVLYIIYADIQSLIKKIEGYKNLQQQKWANLFLADI